MDNFSLTRALTKRMKHHEDDAPPPTTPARAMSIRQFDKPIDRTQISLPIALLSTTNVLAYNAPDLHPQDPASPSTASSVTSTKSYADSDVPTTSNASSITTPDFSRESSPVTVEPNHLSTYFQSPNRKPTPSSSSSSKSSVKSRKSSFSTSSDAPAVPKRALSHTKQIHQAFARKRSLSQVSNPSASVSSTTPPPPPPVQQQQSPPMTVRNSIDMFSNKIDVEHPFGLELAKVKEVAEEFGVRDVRIWDEEEEQFLVDNGLCKFSVDDYLDEIKPLFGMAFVEAPNTDSVAWL